jgi:hypothetical protein
MEIMVWNYIFFRFLNEIKLCTIHNVEDIHIVD